MTDISNRGRFGVKILKIIFRTKQNRFDVEIWSIFFSLKPQISKFGLLFVLDRLKHMGCRNEVDLCQRRLFDHPASILHPALTHQATAIHAHVLSLLVAAGAVGHLPPVSVVEALALGHAVELASVRGLGVGHPPAQANWSKAGLGEPKQMMKKIMKVLLQDLCKRRPFDS